MRAGSAFQPRDQLFQPRWAGRRAGGPAIVRVCNDPAPAIIPTHWCDRSQAKHPRGREPRTAIIGALDSTPQTRQKPSASDVVGPQDAKSGLIDSAS
ncbi:hypothetical protein GA0070619_2627 [Micromonospora zamorensis]|nr:hypothetical protein GA0070619_2627 [Micromonospora zamorensis]